MIPWIEPSQPPESFPPVSQALCQPDGLLAAGGDLSIARLVHAYRQGIFPWYSEGQPILWWSPNSRAVLWPDDLHVSRSLAKRLRRTEYTITMNSAFVEIVDACAAPRVNSSGTWITREMADAYEVLHAKGFAQSIEVWSHGGELAGGLYGVALGRVFFGESMFSNKPDSSKIALAHLCNLDYALIDCQVPSDHLSSMGASLIPRSEFCEHLVRLCGKSLTPWPGKI